MKKKKQQSKKFRDLFGTSHTFKYDARRANAKSKDFKRRLKRVRQGF